MSQSNDSHYDVAIIGGGAAGLSMAYFLAPHANIIVIEREPEIGYHSSGRSAAMYIEGYENRVVQDLTLAGRDFFFAPPTGFSEHDLVTPAGGLTVAGPGGRSEVEKYLSRWQPTCAELHPVSPDECTSLVPILRAQWLSAGAYDPSWHNIDVHALLSGFQRGIRAHGGTIRTGYEITRLDYATGQWSIRADDAPLTADIVVNAGGAWANHIARLAQLPTVPLTPMRRTAAIIAAPEDSQHWPLVNLTNGQLYFKPESSGLMVCPQDETPTEAMDAFPYELDIAIAMETFHQIAEHPVEHIEHSWAGLRTFAPDRYPVVGFADQHRRFFWLAGQGGFGIQTAPGLGQLAADIVLGSTTPAQPINVDRFLR